MLNGVRSGPPRIRPTISPNGGEGLVAPLVVRKRPRHYNAVEKGSNTEAVCCRRAVAQLFDYNRWHVAARGDCGFGGGGAGFSRVRRRSPEGAGGGIQQ